MLIVRYSMSQHDGFMGTGTCLRSVEAGPLLLRDLPGAVQQAVNQAMARGPRTTTTPTPAGRTYRRLFVRGDAEDLVTTPWGKAVNQELEYLLSDDPVSPGTCDAVVVDYFENRHGRRPPSERTLDVVFDVDGEDQPLPRGPSALGRVLLWAILAAIVILVLWLVVASPDAKGQQPYQQDDVKPVVNQVTVTGVLLRCLERDATGWIIRSVRTGKRFDLVIVDNRLLEFTAPYLETEIVRVVGKQPAAGGRLVVDTLEFVAPGEFSRGPTNQPAPK